QERILNNLEEYEKILNHLKEQRKKEKEMNIRKRIEEKELEIQNLEDQIKKEKDERNTLFKELEELIGIKIIIATEKNKKQKKRNTCSNCGIEGHYLQDCPMIECKICNKKGHIMKFCSERICKICNRKGHIEVNCEQYDPNYANRRRIQNDIGEEFLFGKRFER